MKREIGSEFWTVPICKNGNTLFPASTQWYISGRSALQAIIAELNGCRTVAMPSWCCDSMVKPFADAGMDVHFYPVYFDEGLKQETDLTCDVLFLMDYFGYTGNKPDLTGYRGNVIRDVTHSLFSETYDDADFCFGSLRKWCGVYTGGFAWAKDGKRLTHGAADTSSYAKLREEAMRGKSFYISGSTSDKSYLNTFGEAEELLETVGISAAEERDVYLARRLDAELIRSKRRENAKILMDAFPELLVFPDAKETDCPMFVPILVPDGKRDALRRYLIEHEIYCPIHWPLSELHHIDAKSKILYDNGLSLVCDQRYEQKDMLRIAETIRAFWKE